ncbi:hypothetical protein ACHAXR_010375 [Thalassiosira sp. AJA248-18]
MGDRVDNGKAPQCIGTIADYSGKDQDLKPGNVESEGNNMDKARKLVAHAISDTSSPMPQCQSESSPLKHENSSPEVAAPLEHITDAKAESTPEPERGNKSQTTTPSNTTPSSSKSKNSKGSSSKKTKSESTLEFTWICTECKEAECFEDAEAPLLICDGKCNRPFHPPCANLITLPPTDKPWFCGDCLQQRHQCAVCKEYGADDIDVFCCDAKGCGLFFHENCLNMYSVDVQIVEEEIQVKVVAEECLDAEEKKECEDDVGASGRDDKEQNATVPQIVSRPKFRCPAHECWTCANDVAPREMEESEVTPGVASSGEKKKKKGKKRKSGAVVASMWDAKKDRLFRCLDCPISYHLTCMPPSCRFHELAMLCHEHAYTSKLPYLDAEYSFQAEVEAYHENIKKKEEKRADVLEAREEMGGSDEEEAKSDEEENSFLLGLVGSTRMLEEDQLAGFLRKPDDATTRKKRQRFDYCLPCDFKEEVHSKPPAYIHVNSNRYNPQNRPKRHPPNGENCHCKPRAGEDGKSCGDGCLNRLSYVECVGDETLKSGEKNPYWNCNCGPNCGNRAMSKRQFAKCRPMREHGKGWGLITINGVKKGELVQEYAGAIIDESTKEECLKLWSRDHPNDPNFYVMRLEPGWYIDAREVANMARFINHSCDPNCKLVPVNVSGHIRVAIVCIKDVPAGGFLSYDYQFDTQNGDKFRCRCGAQNCRGTMKKIGMTTDDSKAEKRTKTQLLSEAKARIQRDKKFLQNMYETEKDRLYLTGVFLPGEGDREMAEMVAGGPMERHRSEAQEGRIFLWRNARIGGGFSSRYWRKNGKKRSRRNLTSQNFRLGKADVISLIKR